MAPAACSDRPPMVAFLQLRLSIGAAVPASDQTRLKPGNDNSTHEQDLFERCVKRELVEDLVDGEV